jgi:hypothetical protein
MISSKRGRKGADLRSGAKASSCTPVYLFCNIIFPLHCSLYLHSSSVVVVYVRLWQPISLSPPHTEHRHTHTPVDLSSTHSIAPFAYLWRSCSISVVHLTLSPSVRCFRSRSDLFFSCSFLSFSRSLSTHTHTHTFNRGHRCLRLCLHLRFFLPGRLSASFPHPNGASLRPTLPLPPPLLLPLVLPLSSCLHRDWPAMSIHVRLAAAAPAAIISYDRDAPVSLSPLSSPLATASSSASAPSHPILRNTEDPSSHGQQKTGALILPAYFSRLF